ncbi:hypothetical protein KDL01_17815 [Actinospica durhamensis]|uniref:Uncharacterized protein n=1 Tax=Actinospica durhamensis TaxID=1508375 RepID=A0A941EPV9_9ACTN|nr:hypothetical protein [Actinospica durhamensis]MBR7835135.1 hypothetical protein [Actinospica durhamensis]
MKTRLIDGRVLRSGRPQEVEQELWGVLTVYQALIRLAADAAASRPGLDMDRFSFTVLLGTARDQVVLAHGVFPDEPVALVGAIGRALLANLLPVRARRRMKARSLKTTTKYASNFGKHPATCQNYTFHAEIAIMEEGVATRPRS